MKNNNESKPVTRAHLFARIDATSPSQLSKLVAEGGPKDQQGSEIPASDTEMK